MEALGSTAQPPPDLYRVAGAASKGRWSIITLFIGTVLSSVGLIAFVAGTELAQLAARQGMSSPGGVAMASDGLVVLMIGGFLILVSVVLFILALNEFSQEFWEPALFRDGIVLLVIIAINDIMYAVGVPYVSLVLFIVEGYFMKRIFTGLADGSETISPEAADKFSSAGSWFWIGGWLMIVVIGSIMWLVAYVRAMKGFGALKNAAITAALSPQQPGPSLGGPQLTKA